MEPPPTPDRNPSPIVRILDAAGRVFASEGYDGARVDEIARQAGVNKAMLYYHVGDKHALYTAVLMRNFDRVSHRIASAVSQGGSPTQRLERVIATLSETVKELPDHPRIVLREVAAGAGNLRDDVLARMLEVVEVVRKLLAEGVAAGELRRTDPLFTHLAIVGAVVFLNAIAPLRERAMRLTPAPALPEPTTDTGAFVADLVMNGLAAFPKRGDAS